jgi:two-component system chemotaxis sensor kinase CheA
MAIDDPELVAEFVTESRDHLAHVEGQLLEIEAGGAEINVDLVNTVFRGIHSIKGAAGFLGLTTVNKLAHSLENVLGRMRNRELAPTPAIIDVMLKAADALTQLINNVESSGSADVAMHVDALDRINADQFDLAAAPVAEQSPNSSELPEPAPPSASPTEPLTTGAPAAPVAQQSALPAPTGSGSPTETSIRVQVGVLDSLMNLAGELVLGRNQLMQTLSARTHEGIETVAARLDQVTTELQEAVMRTRMQPIGNVFSKFPRVVRDLSAKLGKQCDMQMEGKDVEVDKTILEAIGDPLTHLVRNSIDHGIESPDVRAAKGKIPNGTVSLRAYHQAGKIRIDIADDGAGIDPARLKEKAIAKGVVTAEQAARMGDREAVRLIFHPGFSTAEKITDVSGRGVGMDVVRTNIEALGGSVDVESSIGQGTTMQITLPLTLAIIPSLIVRSRGERFAVPQVNVLELVRIRRAELHQHLARVKDAEVLRLRGELLPLIRLDDALGLAADEETVSDSPVNVIVIESGQRRYGLVVDTILDSEEIVVKPMGRHIKSSTCLAGATILGDGHVALILDAAGIAEKAHLSGGKEQDDMALQQSAADAALARDIQELLLFRLSENERFAVPMSLVTRIERIRQDAVKNVGGRQLLQYRGASLPLLKLDDFISTRSAPELERYFVIVFRAARHEAGLVVPLLEDICQLALDVDPATFRQKGVAGSFIHDASTIRLLDVVELAELAYPDWFAESPAIPANEGDEAPLVLVAEDSTFFRRQVSDFLTSRGFEVVGCEDGARAWDFLTGEDHRVQLVITDVEMPNMNGFELCRRIKQHNLLGRLPVIALTSLASEADMARGREAGVDDYQVKMDRERVMEAVTRLLPAPANKRLARRRDAETAAPCLSA